MDENTKNDVTNVDVNDDKNDYYEQLAIEDLAYGNHHALNILLDLLIEKNIISEQEFKDKLDAIVEESESAESANIEIPEE